MKISKIDYKTYKKTKTKYTKDIKLTICGFYDTSKIGPSFHSHNSKMKTKQNPKQTSKKKNPLSKQESLTKSVLFFLKKHLS